MSFDLPSDIERDVKRYAKAEQITSDEALVQLLRSGLEATRRKAVPAPLAGSDWEKLKDIDPGFGFFEKMPDQLIDTIESGSRRIRAEKLSERA